MAFVRCPECGSTISSKARTCPKCGYPIKSFFTNPAVIIIGILVLLFLALRFVGMIINEINEYEAGIYHLQ